MGVVKTGLFLCFFFSTSTLTQSHLHFRGGRIEEPGTREQKHSTRLMSVSSVGKQGRCCHEDAVSCIDCLGRHLFRLLTLLLLLVKP